MPPREQRRTPAFFPIIMHEYASSDSSASPSASASGTAAIVTIPANLTTDLDTPEAALYSPEDSMQGTDLACDPEQLEYLYRPMTPDEEEIMRIYEDRIYCPPDMTEVYR